LVVPFPAGGGTDVIARILAERMRGALGQAIIIENATGANGSIGVFRQTTSKRWSMAYYSLSYDLLGDLAPISAVAAVPSVLYVKASLPAKDLKELIVWLRANPNKLM
jgi:tripartite-type tricarboxylate transporter receptor subunit TctC